MTEILAITLAIMIPMALLDTYRMRRAYQLKYTSLRIQYKFYRLNKLMKQIAKENDNA